MIGWYVDVGKAKVNTLTSLDDVTWYDTNRQFTIATANVLDMVPASPVWDRTSPYNVGAEIEKIFGEDYYTLYGGLTEYNKPRFEDASKMVPSVFLMYPNYTAESIKNGPGGLVYWFKSLKRVVHIKSGSAIYTSVYNVLDGGELGLAIGDIYDPLRLNVVYQNAQYWWIPGYTEGMDLTNHLIHQNLSVQSTGSAWAFNRISRSDANTIRLLGALFTKESKPDFNGPPPPDNPYEPGGPSGPGDTPPGTFDDTSDPIPDSSLPTISAANTGFTRIYNPTLAQVQDLARYLWTDESVIQTIWNHIKQFFESPMEAIIGFNLVPVTVPDGGTKNFALMYIDTGVAMNTAANQFVDVDCGIVKLERYYGSALDQSPYTKVSCFLPYIGTVNLNTDEVMGTTLQVKYRVDICSGSCVAKILVDGNVLYQYSGHCAINIPISAADFGGYVQAAIGVAQLAVGAMVQGSGGPSPSSPADPTQQTNQVVTTTTTETQTTRNPHTGRQITTGTRSIVETREIPSDMSSTQASFDALSPRNVSNTVGQIMSSKPHVEHTGSFSGNTGYLGIRRPFLIIERPNMCMPEQYQHFNGFPAMFTAELSSCKGFTLIQQVQLTGLTATNPEQAEILGLLKSGVYF